MLMCKHMYIIQSFFIHVSQTEFLNYLNLNSEIIVTLFLSMKTMQQSKFAAIIF